MAVSSASDFFRVRIGLGNGTAVSASYFLGSGAMVRITMRVPALAQHQDADYGQRMMEQLAANLTRDYGRGFLAPNLWDMKRFIEGFEILQAVSGEPPARTIIDFAKHHRLGRSHYRILLSVEAGLNAARQEIRLCQFRIALSRGFREADDG